MKLPGNLGLKATSIKYISTGVAALGVLAFSAQAEAADIYAPALAPFPVAAPLAPLWSGLYGGAHIGGAWSELKTTDLDNYWNDTPVLTGPFRGFGPLETKQSPSGVFGGGTIGYNMQRGGVVFGIEADFGAMGISGNSRITNPHVLLTPGEFETAFAHISTGFYGDLTGRLGWAWGPWLFYGKGGFAVLEAKTFVNELDPNEHIGAPAFNDTRVGWTAGGGVEYLWNPAWSVKVEYQFFDFGTESSSLMARPEGDGGAIRTWDFNHDLTINTVKVGLNYHLGCCDNAIPLK
jgi:opacity protein-like surface antigen